MNPDRLANSMLRSPDRLLIGDDDRDHFINPDERRRTAMARQ